MINPKRKGKRKGKKFKEEPRKSTSGPGGGVEQKALIVDISNLFFNNLQ